jgi:hypothetical protein
MPKETEQRQLVWEELKASRTEAGIFKWKVHRTKVPGGWLVLVIHNTSGLTFYPDAEHKWDGASLP